MKPPNEKFSPSSATPGLRDLRLPEGVARLAVDDVVGGVLVAEADDGPPVDLEQVGRPGEVEIVEVLLVGLVGPHPVAGVEVEGEQRLGGVAPALRPSCSSRCRRTRGDARGRRWATPTRRRSRRPWPPRPTWARSWSPTAGRRWRRRGRSRRPPCRRASCGRRCPRSRDRRRPRASSRSRWGRRRPRVGRGRAPTAPPRRRPAGRTRSRRSGRRRCGCRARRPRWPSPRSARRRPGREARP